MADDAAPMDTELQAALNQRADDCKALVLENNRGEHYSWHLWLDEHTWDNQTLMSYHRDWHAEDEEGEDQELD